MHSDGVAFMQCKVEVDSDADSDATQVDVDASDTGSDGTPQNTLPDYWWRDRIDALQQITAACDAGTHQEDSPPVGEPSGDADVDTMGQAAEMEEIEPSTDEEPPGRLPSDQMEAISNLEARIMTRKLVNCIENYNNLQERFAGQNQYIRDMTPTLERMNQRLMEQARQIEELQRRLGIW